MQLSKFIALSIAASGANGEFNSDGQKWTLWISDVEKTFLQGQQHKSERSGQNRIYIYIFYISPLYEITDNCYGLCNAPATWYFKVDNDDPLSASFTCHSLERATAAGLCPDRPRG